MPRFWPLLFVAVLGCSRTSLFDSLGPGPVANGGSAAGGSAAGGTGGIAGGAGSGGSAGTGGSAGAPCTAWSVVQAPPVALTDPIGDSMLTSLHADGSHVFVGTMNDNDPSPDPTWRVRVVKDDLSNLGTSRVVMKHPQSVSLSGIGIAIGSGYRGAVTWDDAQGCRFVELGASGAPSASPQAIAKSWCYWLLPSSPGFVVFNSPVFTFAPLTLLALSKHGNVTQTHPDVITTTSSPNQTYPRGIAHFDDGTLLVVWSDGTGGGFTAEHLDQNGNKLGPQAGLSASVPNARFAITSMGGTALAVLATSGTGAGSQIAVQPLDEDGQPTSSPVTPAPTNPVIDHVAVARAGGVALVAWSEGQTGANHGPLHVVPVGFDGKPLGPPLTASAPDFIGTVRLVGTPAGALLVFEAESPGTLTQVFADRLVCK